MDKLTSIITNSKLKYIWFKKKILNILLRPNKNLTH